ncbi:MAG: helix-turn-helix domain-containing protein [Bacteroidota bacterium]
MSSTSVRSWGGILFLFTLGFLPYILTITYRLTRRANNKQERAWLMSLWLFEVVIMVSWIMTILAGLFTETETPDLMVYIGLLATLFIHWVAYFGVYRFKLVNEQQRIRALLLNRRASIPANTSLATLPPREQNPRVTPPAQTAQKPRKHTEENEYFRELERLCAEEKVYRDSTLDRTKVAEMLGISPSYLSQLINEISGDNFSTYINRQRVEDVKQLIVDQEFDAYSLLSIGLECGFSSKTTYYNWFKEITGMTPNAYRKAHQ